MLREKRSEMGRAVLALMLLAGTAGCAVLRPTDPYQPVTFSGGISAVPPSPRPISVEFSRGPLTLQECIEIALANNPDIAAGAWDVESARAQLDAAAGQRWPTLKAVGAYTHYPDGQRLVPAGEPGEAGVFSDNISSGNLAVSMPIFTGGSIKNEIKAAKLLRQSEEHRLARTREELVFNVSSVFYGILGQRRVVESLEFSRKALDEHHKRIKELLSGQKVARVDLLRTEVRLADLEQRTVREKNILGIQRRVLANLLGVRDSRLIIELHGELKLVDINVDFEKSLSRALVSREDYRAARTAVEAQAGKIDADRGTLLPTVSLRGSYGGRWAADPLEKQAGADESEDLGQVGIIVDIPIFEGGMTRARIRKERAKLAVAQERLRKLELRIRLEAETAVLNVGSNRQRVLTTTKAIEQAEESLRIERERYELGKGSITNVLDAQAALLEMQANHYRAMADYNTAIAQLHLAIGGDK